MGLLEFCHVSVGRGTDTPFEVLGAPWVDELVLAKDLNEAAPAGLRFTPVRFTPRASEFAGQECHGVRLTVTDREAVRSAELGLLLAETLHRRYPKDLDLDASLKLLGDRPTLEAIRAGQPPSRIAASWQQALRRFQDRRRPYLLYARP